MISNVYNYYMSQYGHKINSKYDAHTRTQLKSTYGKVVKLNSQSPTYKLDLSESAQRYAIDLKENARELSNIAHELSSDQDNSIIYKKIAASSNEDAVHAEYIRSSSETEAKGFQIQVSQLATNQVNISNYLPPNGRHLNAGTYSFDLNINNLTYEFEFGVDEHDATIDIQSKISRLINRSKIGLHSEILTDSISNTALSITSDATGLPDANRSTIFKIQATEDSSNNNQELVTTLGLDRVAQYPSNAVVEIDGQTKISPANEFTIGKAYAINLKDITNEPVEIGLQANADSIAENIHELMSGYNNMISLTMNETSKQFEGNTRLFHEFQLIAKHYREELGGNGVLVTDSGAIEVDKESIAAAANSGSLDSVFKSINAFKQAIQNKADNIALNPMNYVNNKIIAYKNPRRSLPDPYNSSAYSGMMFSGYI